MSKRPGEELDQGSELQKKLKADMPTASATASKITYGKLKPPTSSASSSAISYAALKKQQVSSMVTSKQVQKPTTSVAAVAATTTIAQSTARLSGSGFSSAPVTTTPTAVSAVVPLQSGVNVSMNPSGVGLNITQVAAGPAQSAMAINMKQQQRQIMERAVKQKEEDRQVRLVKKEAALKSAAENPQKTGFSSVTAANVQQKLLQSKVKEQQLLQQQKKEKVPMTKMEIEMENLKRFAAKKALEDKKVAKIMQQVARGEIVLDEPKNHFFDEGMKADAKGKEVRLDEKGNLVDASGNLIVPEQKKLLKVNKQKKQEEKLKKVMRLARLQNSQIFQDGELFVTTQVKRDRKKVYALNFIEDTVDSSKTTETKNNEEVEDEAPEKLKKKKQQAPQEQEGEGMEEEGGPGSDSEGPSESGSSSGSDSDGSQESDESEKVDFRSLIIKNEDDYKREAFQKSNSRYLKLLHKKKQSLKQKHHEPIPDIEWWDVPLFDVTRRYYLPTLDAPSVSSDGSIVAEASNAAQSNVQINILDNLENIRQQLSRVNVSSFAFTSDMYWSDKINYLIEHPKPFKNEGLPNQNQTVVIPNYMTDQERKKLRRRHRQEKERERQDKYKLGLIPAPAPKVRLKNMMRVLGNEAVADPTKMEALVRQGVADRLKEHLQRNEERKLTKDQKTEKFMKKIKRDSSIECRLAVFRIESLRDRVHKFKVDINAQQMQLHGLLINPVQDVEGRMDNTMPAIVLVEGGPKAIKFYKKLLLSRIKWEKNSYLPKDQNGEVIPPIDLSENKCALVWEGVVKDHSFNKWRVVDADSEVEARRAFSERNVEFYFDMAINYQYPE